MRDERGFTLLETLVAVAIAASLVLVLMMMPAAEHPYAAVAAAREFDAALAYARSIAATSGDGATLVFAPAPGASAQGFVLTVYSGRPDGNTPAASGLAPSLASASVIEASLGAPPFALFVDSSGALSGQGGYPSFNAGQPTFRTIAGEPACPSGGYRLTFSDPVHAEARVLPCG